MAVADFVEQMRQALALTEPDLDTSIGSTVRKIIDAVAEVADEISIDHYLSSFVYDIDAKQGTDLDDFVRTFGYTRTAPRRATGNILFERNTPATENIIIPAGTQIATSGTPSVIFVTVVPAVLLAASSSISVPIQAVTAGSQGNVSSSAIERFVTPIAGVSSFSNPVATSGGTDAETDDDLRNRFKQTVFRNLAGTESMFLGLALENLYVTQANVIGAVKHHIEQIELVEGSAQSVVGDCSSSYEDSSTFGPDIADGQILIPGVHYSFDVTICPPAVHTLDEDNVPDGIYDLEYDYISTASRNDPVNNITNRIEVYVNGVNEVSASETRTFSSAAVFNNDVGSLYERTQFERLDGSHPVAGNYFLPMAHAPVLSLPDEIVIGLNTYVEDTDYFLVNNVSAFGGSPQSLSGIEWKSVANGAALPIPADGTIITLDYTFNAVPRDVAVTLRDWRLVNTDVWVHQAHRVLLDLYMAIILLPGFTLSSVQPTVEHDLRALIDRVGFNNVLQVSDILAVVHAVTGVDAVRFLNEGDAPDHFGIERMAEDGTTLLTRYVTTVTPRRATDVVTGDDEVVVLNNLVFSVKAQNTFGAV